MKGSRLNDRTTDAVKEIEQVARRLRLAPPLATHGDWRSKGGSLEK